MKKILLFAFLLTASVAKGQHTLEKIWQTEVDLNNPESVLLDSKKGLMYVSLVGNKNDTGKVVTIKMDGTLINRDFATGLYEAKGLGRYKNRLYVACQTEVGVVDLKTGKVIKKISVGSSIFLNDIAVDNKGIVYVSDTRRSKVFRIENDKASLYLDSIKSANGLKVIGKDLYIMSGPSLLKVSHNRKISLIATIGCNGDGLEPVGKGDFIATCWSGYIFYVYANGRVETLLDTHEEKINTADIAFDKKNRILYVPTFLARKVMAYKLR